MSLPSLPRTDRCPICRQLNGCQLCSSGTYKGDCWCFDVPVAESLLAQIPAELRNQACLCQTCVRSSYPNSRAANAVRAGDFYFDGNGLMVLTAEYHLRRGFCCRNGCRHCPYR